MIALVEKKQEAQNVDKKLIKKTNKYQVAYKHCILLFTKTDKSTYNLK